MGMKGGWGQGGWGYWFSRGFLVVILVVMLLLHGTRGRSSKKGDTLVLLNGVYVGVRFFLGLAETKENARLIRDLVERLAEFALRSNPVLPLNHKIN